MSALHINPFFFESQSDRWSFTDRVDERAHLSAFFPQTGRRLLVHGRRRMGKTSLLKNAALASKAVLLYVDVSTVTSYAHLARKLMEAAPETKKGFLERMIEIAKKHFKSVTVTAGKIALAGDLRVEDEQTLEQALNYLNECAALSDQPWTICMDEFQGIRVLGNDRIDWQIRGIIDSHKAVNYIFSGSDHRLMDWISSYDSAFFKQLEKMEIGPIEPGHMARWVDSRSVQGGLSCDPKFGVKVVASAGPCTGDIVRLAKSTFDSAAKGSVADPIATALDAIALIELDSEFADKWRRLKSLAQRRVLLAVAAGLQPSAAETLKRFGISSASTATSAVESLLGLQLLVRTPKGLHFDSPFFKRWLEVNAK